MIGVFIDANDFSISGDDFSTVSHDPDGDKEVFWGLYVLLIVFMIYIYFSEIDFVIERPLVVEDKVFVLVEVLYFFIAEVRFVFIW
jgi:hypothetical protein